MTAYPPPNLQLTQYNKNEFSEEEPKLYYPIGQGQQTFPSLRVLGASSLGNTPYGITQPVGTNNTTLATSAFVSQNLPTGAGRFTFGSGNIQMGQGNNGYNYPYLRTCSTTLRIEYIQGQILYANIPAVVVAIGYNNQYNNNFNNDTQYNFSCWAWAEQVGNIGFTLGICYSCSSGNQDYLPNPPFIPFNWVAYGI